MYASAQALSHFNWHVLGGRNRRTEFDASQGHIARLVSKPKTMVGEMGHQVKVLATKPEDMSSVFRTRMIDGGNQLLQKLSSDFHRYAVIHAPSFSLLP